MDMLKQTGRGEMVVGWYHSHPGFGCWLSGVDINTQQAFENTHPRVGIFCVSITGTQPSGAHWVVRVHLNELDLGGIGLAMGGCRHISIPNHPWPWPNANGYRDKWGISPGHGLGALSTGVQTERPQA